MLIPKIRESLGFNVSKGLLAILWQCWRRGHGVADVVYNGKLLPTAEEIVDIWKIMGGRGQWINLLVNFGV